MVRLALTHVAVGAFGGDEMAGIFLVDDHELVRRGLASVLDAQPDLTIVGEASTCREAATRIALTRPDVAVLGACLPDGSGIELCRHIRTRHPGVRCLVLDSEDDDEAMLAALLADASGYLTESVRAAELVGALRAVADGRRLLTPLAIRRAARRTVGPPDRDARFRSLSLRERQILALIADALTNRQIADRLGLAEKTVKNYVSSLLCKLGFEHRTQAAVFEIERIGERARADAVSAGWR